jgi:hypothetical protein
MDSTLARDLARRLNEPVGLTSIAHGIQGGRVQAWRDSPPTSWPANGPSRAA